MTSEKTSPTLHLIAGHRQSAPTSPKEGAARAAIEARASGPINDREWGALRERLLGFTWILRDWHQASANGRTELLRAA
jgi:hypothetical protein